MIQSETILLFDLRMKALKISRIISMRPIWGLYQIFNEYILKPKKENKKSGSHQEEIRKNDNLL